MRQGTWQNPYDDPRQVGRLGATITCTDQQLRQQAVKFEAVIGPVESVRKDATDGTGAPQIGLDPLPAQSDHVEHGEEGAPSDSGGVSVALKLGPHLLANSGRLAEEAKQ